MASEQSAAIGLGAKFHGTNALQALLKGVPYLGASLEQFIFGPLVELRIRRFEQTLREVAEQVHRLHTENAVSSERFVNLLETVAPAFTRSPDEFKRQRFRDLLIRASDIPAESSDWANAELAGELLTSLAEPALRIVGGLHRLGEGGPWALVSQPVSQIVPQKEFDWNAPQLFGAAIDYDWIVVEQHARHLRELRLIWYNSHDARGGFGGVSLAPLGQFLVAWTIRSKDVDGATSSSRDASRGLSPTGSGFQQVGLVFAGFVVICTSLKFLVQSAEKRRKDKPMKQAFVLGLRSVLATFWAIGTSYTAAALPGGAHASILG